MNKPLVSTAAVLGVVFLVLACVYWFVPAGSLPAFMPGFGGAFCASVTLSV
jgi:uncharacterized BrkB/YihY/UPF0761 family membrane protein